MKHTDEKWRVVHSSRGVAIFGPNAGEKIASMSTAVYRDEMPANANRIVECVNAMAGIEDPQKLRETYEVCKELELDAYHKLKEDYDKLRETLNAVHQSMIIGETRSTVEIMNKVIDNLINSTK